MTRVFTDMEIWVEVRRRVLTGELSKRAACREYEIHLQTLENILSHSEPPGYQKKAAVVDPFLPIIEEILKSDRHVHRKQRHTARRIFERLRDECGARRHQNQNCSTKSVSTSFVRFRPRTFESHRIVLTDANSLSLVRFDRNDYSVPTKYAHRSLTVVATVDEVRIVFEDRLVARHQRSWKKQESLFDPVHYRWGRTCAKWPKLVNRQKKKPAKTAVFSWVL